MPAGWLDGPAPSVLSLNRRGFFSVPDLVAALLLRLGVGTGDTFFGAFFGALLERYAVAVFSPFSDLFGQSVNVGGRSLIITLISFFPTLLRHSSHGSSSKHIGTSFPSASVETEWQLGVCSLGVSNAPPFFGRTTVSGQREFGKLQAAFDEAGGLNGQAKPSSEVEREPAGPGPPWEEGVGQLDAGFERDLDDGLRAGEGPALLFRLPHGDFGASIVSGTQLDGSLEDADALEEDTAESLGGHDDGALLPLATLPSFDSLELLNPIALSIIRPFFALPAKVGSLPVVPVIDVMSEISASSIRPDLRSYVVVLTTLVVRMVSTCFCFPFPFRSFFGADSAANGRSRADFSSGRRVVGNMVSDSGSKSRDRWRVEMCSRSGWGLRPREAPRIDRERADCDSVSPSYAIGVLRADAGRERERARERDADSRADDRREREPDCDSVSRADERRERERERLRDWLSDMARRERERASPVDCES